jgi:Tol biopolymer transport system component
LENWEIFYIDHIHLYTDPAPLTDHPAADILPRLSPDTNRVAFSSNRDGNFEIYTMDFDGGGNIARLTNNGAVDNSPSWSPSGEFIVFESERDGNYEIYRMNSDGSNQVRLTLDSATDFGPIWSRDESKIYWVRVVSSTQGVMMSMDVNGGSAQAITPPLYYLDALAWAPKTDRIAMSYDGSGDGWLDLGLVNADGSNLTTLRQTSPSHDIYSGSWTNDEAYIFYSTADYILYGGIYYLAGGTMDTHPLLSNGFDFQYLTSVLDLFPDARSIDSSTPETMVDLLPAFSRSDGFTVKWEGSDPGPAPICSYYIEYRPGTSGPWNLWAFGLEQSGWFDIGNPGQTLYFRSRAEDSAANWEDWPSGNGDTHTTLYNWKLDGQVLDTRGHGLPNTTVDITPQALNSEPSDAGGSFTRYNLDSTIDVTLSKAGYASPPSTVITTTDNTDRTYWWPIHPEDNLVTNGDFEQPLGSPWMLGGTIPPQLSPDAHSGQSALELGWPFDRDGYEIAAGPHAQFHEPQVVRDNTGTLHAVVIDRVDQSSDFTIGYLNKPVAGEWSDITTISATTPASRMPHLAMDISGNVHVVWVVGYGFGASVLYTSRDTSGSWSPTENLSGSTYITVEGEPEILVDSTDGIHVIWGENSGLMYAAKPAGGDWTEPDLIGSFFLNASAIGTDDRIHLVAQDSAGSALYLSLPAGGGWAPPEALNFSNVGMNRLEIGPDGSLHLVWKDGENPNLFYGRRTPAGTWTSPILINSGNDQFSALDLTVGQDNRTHILWSENQGIHYRIRFPDATWSSILHMNNSGYDAVSSPNADGSADLLWTIWPMNADFYLTHQKVYLHENGVSTITQTIELPASLHKPTLSLSYKLAISGNAGSFTLDVNGTQMLNETSSSDDWTQHWIDMLPWAGQTVTMTLSTDGTFKGGYVTAVVDEVSIGEWLTPVITSINPSQLPDYSNTTITINGENFIQPATVRLNDSTVLATTWIDENTLNAIIPPGLPPDRYDVWVINPGGQEALVSAGLQLGSMIHLPVVRKPAATP